MLSGSQRKSTTLTACTHNMLAKNLIGACLQELKWSCHAAVASMERRQQRKAEVSQDGASQNRRVQGQWCGQRRKGAGQTSGLR